MRLVSQSNSELILEHAGTQIVVSLDPSGDVSIVARREGEPIQMKGWDPQNEDEVMVASVQATTEESI